MLDEEIYGLIVALGILLAMLFTAVMFFFYLKENIKLSRRCPHDEQVQAYVKKEWLKVLGFACLELLLAAALLLMKSVLL